MRSKSKETSAKPCRSKAPRRRTGTAKGAELALGAFAHEILTSLTGILALSDLLDVGSRCA